MLDTINDIRISSKNRSRFDISENVLLAPTWDSRVSRKDDRIIKVALFDFTFTFDRNLKKAIDYSVVDSTKECFNSDVILRFYH